MTKLWAVVKTLLLPVAAGIALFIWQLRGKNAVYFAFNRAETRHGIIGVMHYDVLAFALTAADIVLVALVALLLLRLAKDFLACMFFQLTACAIVFYGGYLFLCERGAPDNFVIEAAIDWAGITAVCVLVQFFQKGGRVINFARFYKAASLLLAPFYLLSFFYIEFYKDIPFWGIGHRRRVLNLIPLIVSLLPSFGDPVTLTWVLVGLFANLLLFAPVGFYLPQLWGRLKAPALIGLIAALSVLSEAVQYIFALGFCDIDDVILNVLGGVLGLLVYRRLEKAYRARRRDGEAKLFAFT
jgi:glycopeptide antibiotics resistance protein